MITRYIISLTLHGTETAEMEKEQSGLVYMSGSPFRRFLPLFCPLAAADTETEGMQLAGSIKERLSAAAAEEERIYIGPPTAQDSRWLYRPIEWAAAKAVFQADDFASGILIPAEGRLHIPPFPSLPQVPGFLYGYIPAAGRAAESIIQSAQALSVITVRVCSVSLWTLSFSEGSGGSFLLDWEADEEQWIRCRG